MILKGKKKHSLNNVWLTLLVIALIGLVALKFKPTEEVQGNIFEGERIFCDAEETEGEYFVNEGFQFIGGATQSDETAFEGNYASKIAKDKTYGLTYIMTDPKPGKSYSVSVWSYNKHPVNAFLVVSSEDGESYYESTNKTVERNGKYWDKRELIFSIPRKEVPELLKIYVYKEGDNDIFFDNFLIKELEPVQYDNDESFVPKNLQINLHRDAIDYITRTKEKSISQGVIFHNGEKVKTKISVNGEEKDAQFRIKGDWLDHLGKYPSLRIEMASDQSWFGMQNFSIQEPYTRGFLRQWVFFKLLDHVDVLHPRYDFFNYQINKDDPIVFSYEEHFTKNLVENANRREGPIVKLTEDRIWDVTKRTMRHFSGSLPKIEEKNKAFWTSEIRAFKEGKLESNPTLKNNFEVAQNLMQQFKFGLKAANEIFDIHRLSKYMALVDITMAKHAITWHNQRFYYNPVTALLEPIGFDAFTSENPKVYAYDIHADEVYNSPGDLHEPLDQLFYDDTFSELYFKYLFELSDPELLSKIINGLEEDIKAREVFINTKFSEYRYNRQEIVDKANKVRMAFEPYANSLLIFRDKIEDKKQQLSILNTHNFPIRVWDTSDKSNAKIIYPQNRKQEPQYTTWTTVEGVKSLKYEVLGLDSIYSKEILNWKTPMNSSPRQELLEFNPNDYPDQISYDGYNYVFKPGKINIKKPIVIPQNSKVIIMPGCHMVFEDKAYFISFSPIDARGEEDDPITVESVNGIGGSFSIIQADGKSRMKYVTFLNQNTLIQGKWNLTGAVTFYESDIDIFNCKFYQNNCEDALNIIRSDFTLNNSHFNDTFGDAFDADFCKGLIKDCVYTDSGNDAIDVSGSFIDINNTIIQTAGDKGVSGGENSKVFVDGLEIDKAMIAVASKDFSEVTLRNLTLSNCQTGLAAFQKKPEFGPATIRLFKHEFTNIKNNWRIEERSQLIRG